MKNLEPSIRRINTIAEYLVDCTRMMKTVTPFRIGSMRRRINAIQEELDYMKNELSTTED